jgi:hypothetical protein
MQKKLIGGIVIFLTGILIFASCAKDTVVYPPSNIPPGLTISFNDTIQPIFTAGCLGSSCHAGAIAPNLTSGQSYNELISGNYVNTSAPASSKIYEVMAPGGLMANHCTTAEADLVLAWIQQGAKDN